MEWHEGVALVRGVAARLLDASGQAPAVPELHHIEISAAGQVNVTGGTIASEPVRRLGQLLQATLGHTEAPRSTSALHRAGDGSPSRSVVRLDSRVRRGPCVLRAPGPRNCHSGSLRAGGSCITNFRRRAHAGRGRAAASVRSAQTRSTTRQDAIEASRLEAGGRRSDFVPFARQARGTPEPRRGGKTRCIRGRAAGIQCSGRCPFVRPFGRDRALGLGRLVPDRRGSVETPAAPDLPAPKPPRLKRTPPSPEPPGVPIRRIRSRTSPNAGTQASVAADRGLESVAWADEMSCRRRGRRRDGELIFSSDSEGVSPPVGVRPQLPSELPANLTTGAALSRRADRFRDGHGGLGEALRNTPHGARLHVPERGQGVAVPPGVERRGSSQVPEDGLDRISVARLQKT